MFARFILLFGGGSSSASGSTPTSRAFSGTDYVPTLAL